jgi:hypothetical protein
MEWCACAADSGVDDAGIPTGCLGFVTCLQACLHPADGGMGGSVTACAQHCGQGYSVQQDNEGAALVSCIVRSCPSVTQCSCPTVSQCGQ